MRFGVCHLTPYISTLGASYSVKEQCEMWVMLTRLRCDPTGILQH